MERWLQTYSALLLSLNVYYSGQRQTDSKSSCSYATAGLVSFMPSSCPVAFRVYKFQVLLFSFELWGFFWWIVLFLCKNWFVDRFWTSSVGVTLSFFCPQITTAGHRSRTPQDWVPISWASCDLIRKHKKSVGLPYWVIALLKQMKSQQSIDRHFVILLPLQMTCNYCH